ncbi:hypothetical protein ADK41_30080 [Streptomyces caelestis]|uniref:Uncharacterized protein n=1 Tax=Streptomyces caelestis TaxID=36816 RepID=A0A0N0S571_9ACTN|nr:MULTISPECIES: hypothetical protein [Streptomyces]KOT32337.1 hypothetical protein ADK41_30080 [Streptomyces caelestis]
MNVITDAEFEEAQTLAPETLRRYLSGKGWRTERAFSGAELWERYVETEPDAPYEVLVPAERRRDYPGRIADILETLAVVEARRPGDILREMRLPPSDWQFLRLTPPGPSGTAPLLDLVSALNGLRELHTAAASSALTPQVVQPAQKPQAVKDHVASVRLDQTRVGSYVVAAHTPLPHQRARRLQEAVRQAALFDADPFPGGPGARASEPYARQVSRVLFAGVTCARVAADESLERDSLADFARFIEAGLSANLCEALVRIAGEERRGYSLSFAWAPDLPVTQASPPVAITPRHVMVLEEGAKDLRKRLDRELGVVLVGMVTRLRAEKGQHREATVYGSFAHEGWGRPRQVRVQLSREHVEQAMSAWRHRWQVVVRGNLETRGNGLLLRPVTEFEVRPV